MVGAITSELDLDGVRLLLAAVRLAGLGRIAVDERGRVVRAGG